MRLLIDTNVILDVLLNRHPFYTASAEILILSERADIQEFVSASAITDIYYIARKELKDKSLVLDIMHNLFRILSIAPVTSDEILVAMDQDWNDFEDCVQYMVATNQSCDYIITRNSKDYAMGNLPIITPEELLSII